MKTILKYLFKDEWLKFEEEMRELELQHYLDHRKEIIERDEIIKLLREQITSLIKERKLNRKPYSK